MDKLTSEEIITLLLYVWPLTGVYAFFLGDVGECQELKVWAWSLVGIFMSVITLKLLLQRWFGLDKAQLASGETAPEPSALPVLGTFVLIWATFVLWVAAAVLLARVNRATANEPATVKSQCEKTSPFLYALALIFVMVQTLFGATYGFVTPLFRFLASSSFRPLDFCFFPQFRQVLARCFTRRRAVPVQHDIELGRSATAKYGGIGQSSPSGEVKRCVPDSE